MGTRIHNKHDVRLRHRKFFLEYLKYGQVKKITIYKIKSTIHGSTKFKRKKEKKFSTLKKIKKKFTKKNDDLTFR